MELENAPRHIPIDPGIARKSLELWHSRNTEVNNELVRREKDDPARWAFFFNAVKDVFGDSAGVPLVRRGADFTCWFLGQQSEAIGMVLPDFGPDVTASTTLHIIAEVRNIGSKPGLDVPLTDSLDIADKLYGMSRKLDGEQYDLDETFWDAVREAGTEENEEMLPYFIAGAQIAAYGIGHAIQYASDFREEMEQWLEG